MSGENEVTELWRDYRKHQQARRAQRREDGRARLIAEGVSFQEHNGGAHLIVMGGQNCVIDYWPGTAKWYERGTSVRGRGCSRLLRLIDHRAKQMAERHARPMP